MRSDQFQRPKYPDLIVNLSDLPVDTSARAEYVQKLLEEIGAHDVDEFIKQAWGLGPSELIELLEKWVTLE